MNKRHLLLLLFPFLFLATFCEKAIEVQSIAISQPSAEMEIGTTLVLKATVSPSNALYEGLTWTSTKPRVASVTEAGLVTAISEGSATITVMAGGKTASCLITVVSGYVAVSSVSLNETSLELVEGDTRSLTATVSPSDATDKSVIWKSSDSTVASVDNNGKVTAVKEGEATITVIAGDKTATCKVVIRKKMIPVTSLTLNHSSIDVYEGGTETLIAYVLPTNTTDSTVTWESSNTSVATVNSGVVTAVSIGEATISATAGNKTANCKVTVKAAPFYSFEVGGIYYIIDNDKEVSVTFGPRKYRGKLSIPDAVSFEGKNYKVTHLGYAVFYGCFELLEFDSGDGLVEIPTSSFENCQSLSKISIGRNVTFIGKDAFKGCISLKEVIVSDSPKVLTFESEGTGPLQLRECPVETLYLGRDLSYSLPWGASFSPFPKTLQSVIFGSQITVIPIGCCRNCKELTQIAFPSNIKIIAPGAFAGTSISKYSIPNTIERIGDESIASSCEYEVSIEDGENNIVFTTDAYYTQSDPFERGKIKEIYLGRNITYHDYVNTPGYTNLYSPLAGSSLHNVGFGSHFTQIGSHLFYRCQNLQKVSIPNQIVSIKEKAFDECPALKVIYVDAKTPISDITDNSFSTDTYMNSTLYVPKEAVNLYRQASVWKNFRNIVGQ